MDFVSKIDNAFVWAKQGGVYRQADLYRRGETLFIKWGAGFVRLAASGTTSVPKLSWLDIDTGGDEWIQIPSLGAPKYLPPVINLPHRGSQKPKQAA